ncbi:MAG: peptide chain release factor N(5)-glutamine methyltransferase [Candidatus Kinetoplastibacterium crithidii]|nr:MAG: peptide chain release factor N(5)-glutamine methyltransferase [Candidatus Kinetoplastibacterium crithidii]
MVSIKNLIIDSGISRLETMILLEMILHKSRSWIIAHDDEVLSDEFVNSYMELNRRRLNGEPIAYIVGYKEFMNYMFMVNRNVLIPRPETELIVEHGLKLLRDKYLNPRVIDLGTGCGAIGISIALNRPDINVVGCDLSSQALEVARHNVIALGATVELIESDWFKSINPEEKFDLLLANPPYISREDKHLMMGDLIYEPRLALTDESIDGLGSISKIVETSPAYMKEGASLWIEHAWNHASSVKNIMESAGFKNVYSLSDLSGIERVTGGFI